jgi:type IV pilus assembly protein PilM
MAGAQSAWGIDVGVSALKAIKLRKDGGRVTVEAFDVIEHDKFLTEADADRDALIRGSLQRFMAKYGVRRETVFIGVPGSMTFARFVKLPPVETKKIPEIVRFEAIQQIPFPLDQVNWDYHTFQHPDSPDVEVGIFAMKKELVAQVMSNFAAVEMPVSGVQMSPLAVYNAAAYDGMTHDKGTILIDMGAEHTDLVIMDQGRLWLRTINIGGNHFTDALAKSFKQSFTKAESLKKTAATSKYQKQIYQSMRPIFADLVAEIQRSIGHYSSTHRDSRLDRVVGMGNPFKLPNLQKYLQQELKMEVVRVEQFQNANVEKAAAFNEEILSMGAAYGLAVQALGLAPIQTNLLPVEIARKMMWRRKTPWFVGAAVLVGVGAAAMFGQYWMSSSAYAAAEPKRAQNDSRLHAAQAELGNFTSLPDTFEQDKAKVDSQLKLAENRAVWPMLQLDILGALPQNKAGYNPARDPRIVIMDVRSDYKGKLSDWSTDKGAITSIGITTVTPTDAPIEDPGMQPTPAPAPQDQPGAAQQASKVIGDSDRGFIVSLTGYTNSGDWKTVETYRDKLMALSPVTPANPQRPYYFSSPGYLGRNYGTVTGTSGFGAIGTPATVERGPWGGNKGPYWEMFVQEITGIKPAPPLTPGQPGSPQPGGFGGGFGGFNRGGFASPDMAQQQIGEITFPIDLTGEKTPAGPRPDMRKSLTPNKGYYQFKMLFKVHVK